jgi:histone acetyltransferase (RNA polymerase elongator complex component)
LLFAFYNALTINLFKREQNYLILLLNNKMSNKHFNIPVFIPEAACPFRCVFCNQFKISGQTRIPTGEEITGIIEKHLTTINTMNNVVELAFFGGSFTGLPPAEQEKFLLLAQPYIESERISGIRISTRPDYINPSILQLLKNYNVTVIELGAQSMDDDVLMQSGRGHKASDTEKASAMILDSGFSLGLQMMIGLPGDTLDKSLFTAQRIIELGAVATRIYPTLVIKNTSLESLYKKGEYKPLSLEETVIWCTHLLTRFEEGGVDVIRLGLHPSEGLLSGDDLVAGPFHPSLKELVLTGIWNKLMNPYLNYMGTVIEVYVAPGQLNYAIGYGSVNRNMLKKKFRQVYFKVDPFLTDRKHKVFIIQ